MFMQKNKNKSPWRFFFFRKNFLLFVCVYVWCVHIYVYLCASVCMYAGVMFLCRVWRLSLYIPMLMSVPAETWVQTWLWYCKASPVSMFLNTVLQSLHTGAACPTAKAGENWQELRERRRHERTGLWDTLVFLGMRSMKVRRGKNPRSRTPIKYML